MLRITNRPVVFLQAQAFAGDGVARETMTRVGWQDMCALPDSEYILYEMRGLRFFMKHHISFPLAILSAARRTHSSVAMGHIGSTLVGLVCSHVLLHPLQRDTIRAIAACVKVYCYTARPFVAETSSGVTPNRRQGVGSLKFEMLLQPYILRGAAKSLRNWLCIYPSNAQFLPGTPISP